MIDPNCRPGAITDRSAYQARLARILRRADVVKVSVEDLSYLYPGAAARDAEIKGGCDRRGSASGRAGRRATARVPHPTTPCTG